MSDTQPLATITADGKNICAYCNFEFTCTPRHIREGLHRYCSHGCRLAVEMPTVPSGTDQIIEDVLAAPEDTEPTATAHYSGCNTSNMMLNVMLDDPVSFCILLYGVACKWRHPITGNKMSQQDIGNKLGSLFRTSYTRAAISKRMCEIARKYPALGRWLYHEEKRRA